ncbi:MAG: hypothetical protein A2287_01680 [Candidatus Melainabacteria bacterium RIFOXYA12_FULL_32_12]|nr:MAG: hypothetical protein A2255_04070 [Candidatus Melainabacteria bacterium RIFOXYA2_FULL_32_9]OGI27218.1 MAG: hypothetical protein A2287_01680 [Candidatus Melainabacteria bacterium RIFOXYA12_FULL_32_12]
MVDSVKFSQSSPKCVKKADKGVPAAKDQAIIFGAKKHQLRSAYMPPADFFKDPNKSNGISMPPMPPLPMRLDMFLDSGNKIQ